MPVTAVIAAGSPEGAPVVAVLVKRTFAIGPRGAVRLADEQLPLAAPANEPGDAPYVGVAADGDHWPVKLATDVVVTGRVHAPGGRPVTEMTASVRVGTHEKRILVRGDRRASASGRAIAFTDPEPFTSIELTYARAYGGVDRSVPLPQISDLEGLAALIGRELAAQHPGLYPRNPAGIGYAVTGAAEVIDGLRLPNFEDPERPLTPEGLVVGRPEDWWKMPMPQGLGWFSPGSYPRCLFLGTAPEFLPPDDGDLVEEVRRGLVPRGMSRRVASLDLHELFDWRFTNGASPGLAVPHLAGDEPVRLSGLSPEGDVDLVLPGMRPAVTIAHRGQPLAVTVALHTLLLEPDQRRLSMLWGARAPLPSELAECAPGDLAGVEVTVDGRPAGPGAPP